MNATAWECAWVLVTDYADRLTMQQLVACHIAVMRGPERAPLDMIALAARVIEQRQ